MAVMPHVIFAVADPDDPKGFWLIHVLHDDGGIDRAHVPWTGNYRRPCV